MEAAGPTQLYADHIAVSSSRTHN